MTDLAALPPQVLVKIAMLEARCIGLTGELEASRRELQRLRIEARDLAPRTVHDEYSANRESERLIAEAQRLDAAIAAQIAVCERQEKRLATEERIIRDAKTFLHELPSGARLRVVEGYAGDLDVVRQRIVEVRDEIARVERLKVASADLPERIARFTAKLAARAQPVVRGIADGETLSVHFPLRADADRVTMSGFSEAQANPLLMAAFLDGERLTERLLACATDGSISASERDARLRALQDELTALRYDEEVSICAAIERGDDVSRNAPPWSVLMVEITHQAQAAA